MIGISIDMVVATAAGLPVILSAAKDLVRYVVSVAERAIGPLSF
jgi:hypothetical protein